MSLKEALLETLGQIMKQKILAGLAWLKQQSMIWLMKAVYGFLKARRKMIAATPWIASVGIICCLIRADWKAALICYGVSLSALAAKDSSQVVFWFKKWKFDDYPGKQS